jgi:hypothetical protein
MAKAAIGNLAASITMYQNKHNGRLPASLKAMVGNEISDDLLLDPWGNLFLLQIPAKRCRIERFDVFSVGKDGIAGNDDDVGNFDLAEIVVPPPTPFQLFKSWIW